MRARLIKKRQIAQGTIELEFDLLGMKPYFESGQHFYLELIDPPFNDEKGKERIFSIVNPPEENGLIRMATRMTGSAFKKSLEKMEIGQPVFIHSLVGKFLLPINFRNLCFIAGGIGITPFMNFLSHIQMAGLDYDIVLLYSNRDQLATAYFNEINKLSKELSDFKSVMIMTDDKDWPGEKRIIDEKVISDYVPDYQNRCFMVAGPPGMTKAINLVLTKNLKIMTNRVMMEKFIGY